MNEGTKIILVVVTILVSIWFMFWHIPKVGWHVKTFENGQHTGYITAIETSGIFWKVDTAYVKTDLSSSQEDVYCLLVSDDVKEELRQKSINKEPVTVTYIDYAIRGWENCSIKSVSGIIVGTK